MKQIITILIFLCFGLVQAQQYHIGWKSPNYNITNTGERTLTLDFQDQSLIDQKYKVGHFNINIDGNVPDLKFSEVEYLPCTEQESAILDKDLFENKIVFDLDQVAARSEILTRVHILPIVKGKDGKLYKIKSFKIQIPKNNARVADPSLSKLTAVNTSVLSKGDWYKVSVADAGVFKIDYGFLKNMGLSVDQLDPKTLQIYGFGGMLPEKNSDFRYQDLPEIPVKFIGNADAKFDANEYLLVYLQGPHKISYSGKYNYQKNLYSEKAYYFITHSQNTHKNISPKPQLDSFDDSYDYYDFYHRHESDEITYLPSGRKWWGESLAKNPSLVFNVPMPDLVDQSDVVLTGSIGGSNTQNTVCNISFNNSGTTSYILSAIPAGANNYTEVRDFEFVKTLPSSSVKNNYVLNIQYGKADFNKLTNLDYFQIEAIAKLNFKDNFLIFRNKEIINGHISRFNISSTKSNFEVWDVSKIDQISSLPLKTESGFYAFNDSSSNTSAYVAVDLSASFSNPVFDGKIEPQNLHANPTPDLLIITHSSLKVGAEELASFRRSHNGYDVSVITVDKIYNEFSSGAQDLSALRDYIKHLYNNDPSKLKWVLLFGACSYDYKDRIANNTNLVPVYETEDSYNTVYSFSSDDYIGFLDPQEGGSILGGLDVAIGRIPARNLPEAQAAVKKLIYYATDKKSYDSWKNNISFACDDGDGNSHLTASEELVTVANNYNKALKISKLYLPLFPEEASPIGQTSPTLNQRIINDVERGTFILNYSGHGREIGWASENIIILETIKNFKNIDKLFLLIAGTCEFGRYDSPLIASGVQEAFFNTSGGAIATIAATRPVYASNNKDLNKALLRYIYEKSNGSYRSLGEILRKAKLDYFNDSNSKSYALLGDPSCTLNYPKNEVSIDSIMGGNGQARDTIKALSKITIKGSVKNSGNVLTDFNGEVTLVLYDKEFEKTTKFDSESEEYVTIDNYKSIEKKVNLRESIIYQGKVEVKNGLFELSCIIPKDISYLVGKGLILSYAKNHNLDSDAWGGYTDFFIGDSEDEVAPDNNPAVVRSFINDTTFKNGGLTGRDIIFIAKISDESGINLSRTAVGHEIVLTLDDNEATRYVINEYYISEQNSFNKGIINYPLYNLAPGKHKLTIKVWDVHNNSTVQSIEFEVVDDPKLQIGELYVVPSPDEEFLNFKFSHNRAGENLVMEIEIFDAQGHIIKELHANIPEASSVVSQINWVTKTINNEYNIVAGFYIYKLSLKSERDGASDHKTQKFIFTKQP